MKLTPDLIGKWVKVWLNYSRSDDPPHVEGKVIGYCDHPTIIVQDAEGKQSHHSSQLRIEVVEPLCCDPAIQWCRRSTLREARSTLVRASFSG